MRITAIVAATAIAVAACSDSTSPDASTLSFSYTGAGAVNATSFSATGSIPVSIGSSLGSSPWAAGTVDASSDFTTIGAAIPRSAQSWDITSINIARKTVGTSQVEADCDFESTDCTGMFMALGLQPDGDDLQYFCALLTGSVSITEISSTNISGTFTGTGSCVNSTDVESAFTVTNGAFSVAITPLLLQGASAAPRLP